MPETSGSSAPGFVPLPSGFNPAPNPAGFAQAASSSYTAGLQFATALRAAAAQQQVHQDMLRQQQFKDQLQMAQHGDTPMMQNTGTTASGLKTRDPDPQFAGPEHSGHVLATPFGQYHIAQPDELKAAKTAPLDDSNSIVPAGDLKTALEANGWKEGQRIKTSEADSVMNRLENANKPLVHYTSDDDGTLHVFHTDPKTQKTAETSTIPGATKPKAPPAQKGYQFSYHTSDDGTVHVLRGDPDSGEVQEVKAIKGAGARRKDPDAVAPPKPATPAQLNGIDAKKRAGFVRAELQFKRAMKDAKVGDYTDEDKVREAADALTKAKQETQDAWEESAQKFGIQADHVDYASQEPAPARGAATQAQGKPAAQPKPAQAAAAGGGGRVRVQLSNGKTGTIDAGEFDAKTMKKLGN